jgi:DNA-binding response OmpR family regulator
MKVMCVSAGGKCERGTAVLEALDFIPSCDRYVGSPSTSGRAPRNRSYALFSFLDAGQSKMADGLKRWRTKLNNYPVMTKTHAGVTSYRPEDVLPAPRILIVDDKDADAIEAALRAPESTIGRLKCEISKVEDITSARSYLRKDLIDLYFLDIGIAEKAGETVNREIGKAFVRDVVDGTDAGIIVCTGRAIDTEDTDLLEYGADDYVEKYAGYKDFAARTLAIWRRALLSRQKRSIELKHTHLGRTFLLGNWRFTVGNRMVTNKNGDSIKVSIHQHAFLRHLCVVEDHVINGETFNIEVLGRELYGTHVRLDVFVPRLRDKFKETIEIESQGRTGFYKLLGVQEIPRSLHDTIRCS